MQGIRRDYDQAPSTQTGEPMAGRKPSVRYWKTRGAYCCELRGKQYTLAAGPEDDPHGATYLAALTRFKDILALENAGTAGDRNSPRVVIEFYLRFLSETAAPKTLKIRRE